MKLGKILAAFFSMVLVCALTLAVTGCTTAQLNTAQAEATAAAQTAENVLETINTDTGGGVTIITTAAANAALKATHNAGDEAVVDATIAEVAKVAAAQQAAAAAGVTSTTGQTITTAVLTDPNTTAVGANAALPAVSPPSTSAAVPATTTSL